jgi:hypothetical protein
MVVRVGDADVVQEVMTAYYRGARDIIARRVSLAAHAVNLTDAKVASWNHRSAAN